jgi:hypothetical protein
VEGADPWSAADGWRLWSPERRKLVLEIAGAPARVRPARMRERPEYNCRIGEEIWQRNMDIFMEP